MAVLIRWVTSIKDWMVETEWRIQAVLTPPCPLPLLLHLATLGNSKEGRPSMPISSSSRLGPFICRALTAIKSNVFLGWMMAQSSRFRTVGISRPFQVWPSSKWGKWSIIPISYLTKLMPCWRLNWRIKKTKRLGQTGLLFCTHITSTEGLFCVY